MRFIRIYDSYKEATFVKRINRFVVELDLHGRRVYAHLPNTGRLYEFLEPGKPFYIVDVNRGRYPYRAVSTVFDGQFVFIDTIKSNYLFYLLLKAGAVEGLKCGNIRREYNIMESRFDFFLKLNGRKVFVELKTCTLCFGGLGMFPDAPTMRGKKHIEKLVDLVKRGYSGQVVFLIPNYNAIRFAPNYHVDREYASSFVKAKEVTFRAFKIKFVDPITADFSSLEEVMIDYEAVRKNLIDKGTYVLVLRNDSDRELDIGRLGKIRFKKGFYVYVGSAQGSLQRRLMRHLSTKKKKRWHIDYLGDNMKVFRVFTIRGERKYEKELAMDLMGICDDYVPGFGAGDSRVKSHLFYFHDGGSSLYPLVLNKVYLRVLSYQVSSLL